MLGRMNDESHQVTLVKIMTFFRIKLHRSCHCCDLYHSLENNEQQNASTKAVCFDLLVVMTCRTDGINSYQDLTWVQQEYFRNC